MACALLLCSVCIRDSWFLIYLSIVFFKISHSFLKWRILKRRLWSMVRKVLLIIERIRLMIMIGMVIGLMIGRIVIMIGMLEVVWMVWPWVIIVVLAPWEIRVIFSVRIVCWCVGIIVGPWKGHIHRFKKLLLSLEHWTLLKHMIYGLTISTVRSWKLIWADLVGWNWLLSF